MIISSLMGSYTILCPALGIGVVMLSLALFSKTETDEKQTTIKNTLYNTLSYAFISKTFSLTNSVIE
jgi:hypothetical protein